MDETPARIRYRSVRERTLDDDLALVSQGYENVLVKAIDELNQGLVLLQDRIDKLEGRQVERRLNQGDPED